MVKKINCFGEIDFVEDAPKSLTIVLPLFVLLCITYLFWRFSFTVNWLIWFAIPLFILEIYNFLNTLFFLLTTRKIWYPKWKPPLKDRTVDIFIPTYNEPDEIVEMTTIGALHVRGVNKVFVLDDGNRSSVRKMAKLYDVTYLARGENSDAKAGNLNYGLKFSKADFVVNVDCDHVPQANLIERLLGYFEDPKLGFIQTPQVFYNKDSIQHKETETRLLWNEQTMFYESIQPGKNRYNASFFCGSGGMIRRKALDSVSGYATGTATEDIHTSIRLHSKGWKSLFVHENLAFGLAAEDLKEYHKQRVRWGAGSLGLLFRSADSPLWAKGLSLMQRFCYINSTMAYMEGTLKLFYFIVPIYVILTKQNLIDINLILYFATYLPFLFLSYFITYYYSRRTYHFPNTELFNIINIFSHIESIKGIIKIQKKFGVSIKVKNHKQSAIIYPGLILVLSVMLLVDIYGGYLIFKEGSRMFSNYLLIGIFWNTFNLGFVIFALIYLRGFNSKNREEHKFIIDQKTRIYPNYLFGEIKKMSLSGAIIETEVWINEQNISFDLDLAEERMNLRGQVKRVENIKEGKRIYIQFNKLDKESRVKLTLFFFEKIVPNLFRQDFKIPEESYQAIPKVSQVEAILYSTNKKIDNFGF